jgi:hypothetical protein
MRCMSMWLSLAKVDPSVLSAVRAQPDLLDAYFEYEGEAPAGFDPRSDLFSCDYRTLTAIAEAKAEDAGPGTDWTEAFPWLVRATGEADGDELDYEFTYGPAFVLDVHEVPEVVAGLTAEGWSFDALEYQIEESVEPDEDGFYEFDEDDEEDDGPPGDREFDDFVDLIPFLSAAAREGKAVIGGVE